MKFECYGVLDGLIPNSDSALFSKFILERIAKAKSETIIHVIISANFGSKVNPWHIREHDNRLLKYLNSIWDISAEIMITRIGSERLECVQKEQYRKFYRNGGQIKTTVKDSGNWADVEYETWVDKSVGDDIEDFYNRIKMKKIALDCVSRTFERFESIISLLDPSKPSVSVRTFHLSMLTDQEESEMHSRGRKYENGYARFEHFKNKTTFLNNEQNFALSLCARKSNYITKDNLRKNGFLFNRSHTTT